MIHRCGWAITELSAAYHDTEWGVPVHDNQLLFEFLVLEGAQAGLSWETILKKRPAYRLAFDGFDPVKVAAYGVEKQQQLLQNAGIIRNRLKIAAAVDNARAFLAVQDEFGSFDSYFWRFSDSKTIHNSWQNYRDCPAVTPLSTTISKDLQRRGFRFVGPTICYALMQAVGMVNDHEVSCFRYAELLANKSS